MPRTPWRVLHCCKGPAICTLALLLLVVSTSCPKSASDPIPRKIGGAKASSETVPALPSGQDPVKSVARLAAASERAGGPVDKPGKGPEPNPFGGCDTCHVDSSDELVLSVHHTEEKIGCVKCHGKSDGHISDENNEVKPDRLFPPDQVDKFCGECHECDRPDETRPKKPPKNRRPNCIDCHHPHSLFLTVEADREQTEKQLQEK